MNDIDKRKKLPKGFYEYFGPEAEIQQNVFNHFLDNGSKFGYQLALPCEVGFQDTYLTFGNAAQKRSYCFSDAHGNQLMLSADSLATTLRVYSSAFSSPRNARIMAQIPIFRYRKKKYRRWHHLIYTLFNENDEILASYNLILSSYVFLKEYANNIRYEISLYGIFEELCKHLSISRDCMYWELYLRYEKNEPSHGNISHIIADIEKIGLNSKYWKEAFEKLKHNYPCLEHLLNQYSEYFNLLEKSTIPFSVCWNKYHAIEYSSGICFIVYTGDLDKVFADGGSYKYIVEKNYPDIHSCYSFACSLETLSKCKTIENNNNNIYLLKLDCSHIFFQSVCSILRNDGYCVHELKVDKPLFKVLKYLPPKSKYIIIGSTEELHQEFTFDKKTYSVI